jgi:hypothetical protein
VLLMLGVLLVGCSASHRPSPTPTPTATPTPTPSPTPAQLSYIRGQLLVNNWEGPMRPPGTAHYSGASATINLSGRETTRLASARSGRFTIAVPPGRYVVTGHVHSAIPFRCAKSRVSTAAPGSITTVRIRCSANIG